MEESKESEFQVIATETIESAEQVCCSGPEFVAGLKLIIDSLVHRWEGARSEFGEDQE